MRKGMLVCVLVFWSGAALADSSRPVVTEDGSSPAVEQFQLHVSYGLGVNEIANVTIIPESPFQATARLRTMSVVLRGMVHRATRNKFELEVVIEEVDNDGLMARSDYRKEITLRQWEDLAALVYYSIKITRSE